jgi:hypothetical protein
MQAKINTLERDFTWYSVLISNIVPENIVSHHIFEPAIPNPISRKLRDFYISDSVLEGDNTKLHITNQVSDHINLQKPALWYVPSQAYAEKFCDVRNSPAQRLCTFLNQSVGAVYIASVHSHCTVTRCAKHDLPNINAHLHLLYGVPNSRLQKHKTGTKLPGFQYLQVKLHEHGCRIWKTQIPTIVSRIQYMKFGEAGTDGSRWIEMCNSGFILRRFLDIDESIADDHDLPAPLSVVADAAVGADPADPDSEEDDVLARLEARRAINDIATTSRNQYRKAKVDGSGAPTLSVVARKLQAEAAVKQAMKTHKMFSFTALSHYGKRNQDVELLAHLHYLEMQGRSCAGGMFDPTLITADCIAEFIQEVSLGELLDIEISRLKPYIRSHKALLREFYHRCSPEHLHLMAQVMVVLNFRDFVESSDHKASACIYIQGPGNSGKSYMFGKAWENMCDGHVGDLIKFSVSRGSAAFYLSQYVTPRYFCILDDSDVLKFQDQSQVESFKAFLSDEGLSVDTKFGKFRKLVHSPMIILTNTPDFAMDSKTTAQVMTDINLNALHTRIWHRRPIDAPERYPDLDDSMKVYVCHLLMYQAVKFVGAGDPLMTMQEWRCVDCADYVDVVDAYLDNL